MGALGISKYANTSIFVGTAIHIAGLCILFATGNFSAVTLAGMTSVSEISILSYRLFIVYKHRRLLNGGVGQ
jgi:O-antigen/teichoic acid export membrane protein